MIKGTCPLCLEEKNLIMHHISYLPQKTMRVCRGCHTRIHKDQYPELKPSRRMVKIFYAGNNILQDRAHPRDLRKLTEKEIKIREAMLKI